MNEAVQNKRKQSRKVSQRNYLYDEEDDEQKKVCLSESFQEVINLQIFNLSICIIHNDTLCVATLGVNDKTKAMAQLLTTRYFMSQFWCEFTKEVLSEFLNEDLIIQKVAKEKEQKEQQRLLVEAPPLKIDIESSEERPNEQ